MKSLVHLVVPLRPILCILALLPTILKAQGTLYVSNFEGRPANHAPVASDDWIAQPFVTGTATGGYSLDSIEILLGGSSGGPSGFTLSIFNSLNGTPYQDIDTLSGSSNPTAFQGYTYVTLPLNLSSSTEYFVVASASTPSSTGSYQWYEGPSATGTDGWTLPQGAVESADQGADWSNSGNQIAFYTEVFATPVPEPSTWAMVLIGGIAIMVGGRRKTHLCSLRSLLFLNEWFG